MEGGVMEVSVVSAPKGKRTKRSRPHSPIPFIDCDSYMMINRNNVLSVTTITEEDVDMANCLILLSQGNPPNKKLVHDLCTTPNDDKFISKRYIEVPISSDGKTGMYVYQCKTCGRTFPTFQALGGHRASHKRPKNMAVALLDESFNINNNYKSKKPPPLPLALRNRFSTSFDITNKSPLPKIHECTYCGTEFTSGQALGGHMRCHRGAMTPTTPSTDTTLSLSPIPTSHAISLNQSDHDHDRDGRKTRVVVVPSSTLDLKMRNTVSLDLNLPAQQLEDDHPIQQKQQVQLEPALVLSPIRFIECQH